MSHYADYENQTDYQLGTLLLADWIKEQAIAAGVEVTRAFGEQMVAIAQTVTGKATNAGLAQALHKAAKGDFEGAGADLRQLLEAGVESELKARQTANELDAVDAELANTQAVAAALHPLAKKAMERESKEAKNRAKGVKKLKENGAPTRARVLQEGELIMATRTSEMSGRALAKQITTNIKKSLGNKPTPKEEKGFSFDNVHDWVKRLRKEGKLLKH